jgi:hypothetical protein
MLAKARAEFADALAGYQTLTSANPGVPSYRDGQTNSENSLSMVLRRMGRPAEARDHAKHVVAVLGPVVSNEEGKKLHGAGLAQAYLNLGLARRASGDESGALDDLQRALRLYDGLPSKSGEQWFETACCHAALSVPRGRSGPGGSTAEADSAMGLLRRPDVEGYLADSAYRGTDALDPLRDRDDFRLLMLDLAMPANPFATAPEPTAR